MPERNKPDTVNLISMIFKRNFNELLLYKLENDVAFSFPIESGIRVPVTNHQYSIDDLLLLLSLCNHHYTRRRILNNLSLEIRSIQLTSEEHILREDAGSVAKFCIAFVNELNMLTAPEVFSNEKRILEQASYLNKIMRDKKCSYGTALLDAFEANLNKIAQASDATTKKLTDDLISSLIKEKNNLTEPSTLEQYTTFRKNCNQLIRQSLPAIDKYHDLYQILLNVGLFFIGLGVGYLAVASIKKITTGKFLFFSNKVSSELKTLETNSSLPDLVSDRYRSRVQ